nr:sodium/glucose cotransporter [FCB group bacterium]
DIYKQIINKDASEERLVFIGRVTSAVALLVAVIIAPSLSSLEQAFQFIQEFTGFISPGIFAIFIFGLFWKKATANSAVWAAVLTIPLSLAIKLLIPALPFLNRMGVVFLILSAIVVVITLIEKKGVSAKAIKIDKDLFHTDTIFNVGSIGIFAILAVLYTIWW